MEEMICSFFGHRKIDVSEALNEKLEQAVKKALEYGCQTFYFGGYGEFDSLCYQTVSKIKRENPQIEIKLVFCVALEKHLRKRELFW